MSHLHIPDGLLPTYLWLGGYILAAIVIAWTIKNLNKRDNVPLARAAMIGAFLLLAFSIPLGVPIHLNLAALAGILLGSTLGFLVVFVVNLLLALMGHGGITVLGLNTLIVGSEAIIAGFLFASLKNIKVVSYRAAIVTIVAVTISTVLMLGVVAISTVDVDEFMHTHEHEEHSHDEHDHYATHEHEEHDAVHVHEEHDNHSDFWAFVKWITPFYLLSVLLEASITAVAVAYLARVKPDALDSNLM